MMYRTAADRKAEAARYREMSEAFNRTVVPLNLCQYDRERKVLKLASEFFGMPAEFYVRSHVTGREVRFTPIDQYDVLSDQDGWDGEQQIYRPVGGLSTVDHMVIYHCY